MIDKQQKRILVLLIIIASIMRLIFVFRSMGYDEALSFLVFGSRPLKESLVNYVIPNNHLLHTLFVHIITKILPPYPWVIRIPALLAGIAIVPLSYLVFKRIYSPQVALVVASLVTGSSLLIEYSVNARGYTLMILFFLSALGLIFKAIRENKFQWWLGFAVSSVLGFYTIPVMIYPFSFSILLAAIMLKRDMNKKIGIAFYLWILTIGVIVFLLYLPVIYHTGLSRLADIPTLKPHPLGSIISGIDDLFLKVYCGWNRDLILPLRIIFVISFFVSLFRGRFKRVNRIILLAGVITALGLILITRRIPFPRCFLYLLPVYFGIVASGLCEIGNIWKRDIVYFLCGFLVISMCLGIWWNKGLINSDLGGRLKAPQKIIYVLQRILKPGDKLLAYYPVDAIISYYFFIHRLPYYYLDLNFKQAKRIFALLRKGQDLEYLLKKFPIFVEPTDFRQIIKINEISIYVSYMK